MEEILFSHSPQGKRNKWEQIKSMPQMEEFVRLISEVFGPPTNVKVFKCDRRMEKLREESSKETRGRKDTSGR
jgi:hypothetical protein